MFTGIIEAIGTINVAELRGGDMRLHVSTGNLDLSDAQIGDSICTSGCNDGLNQVQLTAGIPVTFGVLTVDNVDQAEERSAEDSNNKGEEAALTALEMISLVNKIENIDGAK